MSFFSSKSTKSGPKYVKEKPRPFAEGQHKKAYYIEVKMPSFFSAFSSKAHYFTIPEEKDTMIFSGTCVYDQKNSSGLGTKEKPPMVAIYTGHIKDVNQSQHVAFSIDEGKTWTKYNKNPKLDLGKKDFRDPKVFITTSRNPS